MVLPPVVISAIVALSLGSTVNAASKGKGSDNNTGEITLNVDATCRIYIDSENEISNVIDNLGEPNETKLNRTVRTRMDTSYTSVITITANR